MTKDQAFFIQILSDHIAGRQTEPQDGIEWKTVALLTQAHEVGGIVCCQCRDMIPAEYAKLFDKEYCTALFYYANRKKAMDTVSAAMRDAGLSYFSVKGLEIAKLYPVPSLRTMGDCDLVVPPDEFDHAIQTLRALGFAGSGDTEVHEWSCIYKDMSFELHDILVKEQEYAEDEQARFFNDFMPYVNDNSLDRNFHFLFLLMHLRKHFMGGGVGIRQFLDLAVVIRNMPDMDWGWIEEKLEKLKLARFAHACFSLIGTWFGVSAPSQGETLDAAACEEITERILGNGVFGFENADNRKNEARNSILLNRGSTAKNRFVYLVSSLFPGYAKMKGYPGCGFLIGRRYLLPIAWIRRFAHIAKSKENKARIDTVKNTFIDDSDLQQRKAVLRAMGLME